MTTRSLRCLPIFLAVGCLSISASAAVVTIVADRDTTLFAANPDNNLGASSLAAGTTAGTNRSRALLSFNVTSAIPAGSTINSVTFSVGVVRQSNLSQPGSYELHRFLKNWTEGNGNGNTGSGAVLGETTWNSQFHGSTAWSAPGGQAGTEYTTAASGVGAEINTSGLLYEISTTIMLVSDVQSWLDSSSTNNGWVFMSSSEATSGAARRFSSTETPESINGFTTSEIVPQITVNYTIPEPSTACLSLGLLVLFRRRRS